VLDNSGVALSAGGSQLYLAGVDDCWSGAPDLELALDGAPAAAPVVLLAHEPDFADTFALDGRVSLQLSGHSHCGQVRLPGIGALVLPTYGQKYDAGLNKASNMWVYTTRGIGVIGPPVRFNCPPEITEIMLVRKAT
jgi:predicted MPP superfamily phosphohydrolase